MTDQGLFILITTNMINVSSNYLQIREVGHKFFFTIKKGERNIGWFQLQSIPSLATI